MSEVKKLCKVCKESKPLGDFHKCKANRDGLVTSCKICIGKMTAEWRDNNREKIQATNDARRDKFNSLGPEEKAMAILIQRLRRYRISVEKYYEMVKEADGKCQCCNLPCDKLEIDHNYATWKVRGLLCGHCNKAIGLMRERITSLAGAILYLCRFNGSDTPTTAA